MFINFRVVKPILWNIQQIEIFIYTNVYTFDMVRIAKCVHKWKKVYYRNYTSPKHWNWKHIKYTFICAKCLTLRRLSGK